jgi:hypothetical protein
MDTLQENSIIVHTQRNGLTGIYLEQNSLEVTLCTDVS